MSKKQRITQRDIERSRPLSWPETVAYLESLGFIATPPDDGEPGQPRVSTFTRTPCRRRRHDRVAL